MQAVEVKTKKVVACTLTSAELQKHKAGLIASLKARLLERRELTHGYQYRFNGSDEMINGVMRFIKAERACCRFFTFTLSIEDAETNILLTITGPEGAKEFIDSEMAL